MSSDKHYHIIAGTVNGVCYSEGRIENYADSIDKLTTLSMGMFGHLFEGEEGISFDRFVRETEGGSGKAIMVGVSNLCFCWFPCYDCDPIVSN